MYLFLFLIREGREDRQVFPLRPDGSAFIDIGERIGKIGAG